MCAHFIYSILICWVTTNQSCNLPVLLPLHHLLHRLTKTTKTPLLYLLGTGNHVNPGISNLHFICVAIPFFHFEHRATVERYFSISIHLLQWHACQGFPPNSTYPSTIVLFLLVYRLNASTMLFFVGFSIGSWWHWFLFIFIVLINERKICRCNDCRYHNRYIFLLNTKLTISLCCCFNGNW